MELFNLPISHIVTLPYADSRIQIPLHRQYVLNRRVSDMGIKAFTSFCPTSSWVNEILSPGFSMRFLWHYVLIHYADNTAADWSEFRAWAMMVERIRVIARAFQIQEDEAPVMLGFDIERDSPLQEMQYKFLTDLWKGAAHRHLYFLTHS
jgi:hypothetical protein